jgi:hypothetical protein
MEAIVMLALPSLLFYGGAWVLVKASGRDYWNALDDPARRAERRFLELDLLFPFVYCGGLAAETWSARW